MGFKATFIEPFLKHNGVNDINDLFLKKYLWYSTSHSSYIQRTASFDGTAFDINSPYYQKIFDSIFLVLLFDLLNLDELHYYLGNMTDVDRDVDALPASSSSLRLLYLHHGGKSALYSFFDKLRNSLAHGTFNDTNDRFIMIGQKGPNISSTYNYFLQITSKEYFYDISGFDFADYDLLNDEFKRIVKRIRFDNSTDKYRIYVDHSFKQIKNKELKLLNQLEERYSNNDYRNSVVFVPISSNLSLKKLFFEKNNVQVVTANKIFKYLNLPIFNHNYEKKKVKVKDYEDISYRR